MRHQFTVFAMECQEVVLSEVNCFKKVPDIDELGQQLYRMYFVAKHVKEANEMLIAVEPSVPAVLH